MTFLMVVAHGATGPLDEFIEFGVPLILLIGLYLWSNRKPKEPPKDTTTPAPEPKKEPTE
ncbi:MAG TPA: hypothetical protein VI814_01300 [Candidatus Limnocylindria bacterium]